MSGMFPTPSALAARVFRTRELPEETLALSEGHPVHIQTVALPGSVRPRWFELAREKGTAPTDAVPAPVLLVDLGKVHHILCGLSFMTELAEDLRPRVASILVNISKLRPSYKGEMWIQEHERGTDNGYILLKGRARVQRPELPEGICPAPELIGETMQFNPLHECTATVSAAVDSVVMQFTWHDFWARMEETCTKEEQKEVWTALENLAWDHLTKPLHIPSQEVQC